MSERIIPTISGKGGASRNWAHFGASYSWSQNCHGTCGCVTWHPNVLQCLYNEDQGPLEVKSSAILDIAGSNQFFSCPVAVSGLPWWLNGKESTCQCRRRGSSLWFGEIPWRRKWQPTLVFLPGKSPGQRSLIAYRPWGHKSVRQDLPTKQQQQHGYVILLKVVPCPLPSCFNMMWAY